MSRAGGGDAGEPTPDAAVGVPGETAEGDAESGRDGTTVTVWRSAAYGGHDTVTVFVEDGCACRHLVDYASEECRTLLEGLPEGATLPVEMEPVAGRGDGWRVTAVP